MSWYLHSSLFHLRSVWKRALLFWWWKCWLSILARQFTVAQLPQDRHCQSIKCEVGSGFPPGWVQTSILSHFNNALYWKSQCFSFLPHSSEMWNDQKSVKTALSIYGWTRPQFNMLIPASEPCAPLWCAIPTLLVWNLTWSVPDKVQLS